MLRGKSAFFNIAGARQVHDAIALVRPVLQVQPGDTTLVHRQYSHGGTIFPLCFKRLLPNCDRVKGCEVGHKRGIWPYMAKEMDLRKQP